MFHPSIQTRIDQLSKAYEQEYNEALRLQEEIGFFFDYSQATMKKLIEQNNRLLVKLKSNTTSNEIHRKETDLSDQLAQMTISYMPKFKELIAGKPLLDKLLDFNKHLTSNLQKLHQLSEAKERSERIMQALEEEHRTIPPLLDTLRSRLNHCKKHINDLNNFSQHLLN